MPWGVFSGLDIDRDVPQSVQRRFLERVAQSEIDCNDCWIWPRSTASHGYGQIGWGTRITGRKLLLAHRFSYAFFVGPIPDDMTIDHTCRNRTCFNPVHLRMLTNVENARDNGQSSKTECPHGHPYDAENTYVQPSTGHRSCRICMRAAKRKAA